MDDRPSSFLSHRLARPGAATGDAPDPDRFAVRGDDADDVVLLELPFHTVYADRQQARRRRARQSRISAFVDVQLAFGESFRMGDPFFDLRDRSRGRNEARRDDFGLFGQQLR